MMDLLRLFEAERANLARFLRRFGGAVSAEDVVQETFLHLWAANPRDVASPRAYLFATARNLAAKHLRRARTGVVIDDAADIETLAAPTPIPSPEEARIAQQEADTLRLALAELAPLQREALILRRIQKLPAAEVCRRLGVNERAMQRMIEKAIAHCHDRLAGSDNGPAFD